MRLNDALKRVTLVAYLISLSGLLLLTWLAHSEAEREQRAAQWVQHTEGVIARNNALLGLMQRIESTERAYLLTGNPLFVRDSAERNAEVHTHLSDLQVLTADNELQQKNIAQLGDLISQKLELIDARIYLHDKVGDLVARQSAMRSEGREDMELIATMAGRIAHEETRLLDIRTAEHHQVIDRMGRLRNSIVISSIAFLSALFWYLGRLRDRKREAEHHIEHLAYHDALTGLPNRRLLLDRLKQSVAVSTRKTGRFAVLFLDLDGFKKVNDALGHDSGDALLLEVGQRLKALLRESDTVARLGGDEFVIGLMLAENIEDAIRVADKVVAGLSQPFTLPKGVATIGASIGISLYPDHGDYAEALLLAADKALYRAKTAGKNRYAIYDPSMTTTALGAV